MIGQFQMLPCNNEKCTADSKTKCNTSLPPRGQARPDLGCELHFLAIQKNKRETAVSLRLINFVLQLCINN